MSDLRYVKKMMKGKAALKYLLPEVIGKEMVLFGSGINWTWYCHVIIDKQGYATVTKEYRLHNTDEMQGANQHPKAKDHYGIVENTLKESETQGRIAYGLYKGNLYFPFRKPIPRWDVGKQK
jgi:hypothetical protein